MKTLSCKDLGADCNFVAKGDSNDKVIGIMNEHAKLAHPDKAEDFRNMQRSDIDALIKE